MRELGFLLVLSVAVFLFPVAAFAQDIVVGRGEVFSPSDSKFINNTINAKTAFRYMEGYVVEPGAVFSFNRVVGKRTLSRGFVWALSGSGGRYYKDVGGGVCQAATALHRAVVSAGLQVVERHRHPGGVPYAPEGDDAAVWWNTWDYRFRNTLPLPVTTRTKANGQQLVVELRVEGLPEGRAVFFPGKNVWVLDGRLLKTTAAPYTENGRAYAASRDLASALGTGEGDLLARVQPVYRDGITCAPVRDAALAFGCEVGWNASAGCIVIPDLAEIGIGASRGGTGALCAAGRGTGERQSASVPECCGSGNATGSWHSDDPKSEGKKQEHL